MDCGRQSSSPFDCLLFDLDDTLYSSHTGIAASLKNNIEDFLVEKFRFARSQAPTLRVELFKTYNSSLAGLRALGYDVDADDYHSFVHGRLPYDQIKPNPELRNILLSITQRKIIFTNSDRVHTDKVLRRLGIEDCFEQIICFETLNPNLSKSTRPDEFPIILKPSLDAMNIAIDAACLHPHRTLFLDDNVRNVAAGKAVGLKTALVGKAKIGEADYAIETVINLEKVIPEVWMVEKSTSKHDQNTIGRTRSEMDNFLTVGA